MVSILQYALFKCDIRALMTSKDRQGKTTYICHFSPVPYVVLGDPWPKMTYLRPNSSSVICHLTLKSLRKNWAKQDVGYR